jgi:hypothetical protein
VIADAIRAGARATGLGIAISGSIDVITGSGSAQAAPRSSVGYGPLVPDPKGLLSLPAGRIHLRKDDDVHRVPTVHGHGH